MNLPGIFIKLYLTQLFKFQMFVGLTTLMSRAETKASPPDPSAFQFPFRVELLI